MAPAPAVSVAVAVVYALPEEQVVVNLQLAPHSTVREAIGQSGLLQRFPRIAQSALCAGIWGKTVALDTPLRDGDRVEIYRPLTVDPKLARRRRAVLRAGRKSAV